MHEDGIAAITGVIKDGNTRAIIGEWVRQHNGYSMGAMYGWSVVYH